MRYTDGTESPTSLSPTSRSLTSRCLDEGPLASLHPSGLIGAGACATGLARRFCAWRGVSGRRYVASVFSLGPEGPDPDLGACVLIAVRNDALGRRVVDVTAIERTRDALPAALRGRAAGANEWHVHMLGETRSARALIVDDLRRRHCAAPLEALCA